jgi:hypothetical protein
VTADSAERRDATIDASDRRTVPGDALVRLAADGAASAPQTAGALGVIGFVV